MESLINLWQHLPSHMSPVLISLGFFEIKYYGLMYLIAFLFSYLLGMYRIKHEDRFNYDAEYIQNLFMYAVFGVMIGGRLGYVIFYNLPYYISHPMEALLPFTYSSATGFVFRGYAGMSYHGGLLGVLVAGWIFTKFHKADYWNLGDLFAPVIPLGYTFGRLGNFINGELWGRPTSSAIGMYFPEAPGDFLRHPSQLYEGFLEGIMLFVILWSIRKWKLPAGSMIPGYIFGYGFFRFFVEYFREPDAHLGFVFLNFSMGQLLCIAMMLGSTALFLFLKNREEKLAR